MNAEYLIFNLVVILGPLLASFDRKLRFVRKWKYAFGATALAAIPFLAWDVIVTGRHWYFNEAYTLPARLFGLPPGEWLFFFTVPFAALFMWEVLRFYRPQTHYKKPLLAVWVSPLLFGAGALLVSDGLEYTGLVALALVICLVLDFTLQTGVLSHRNTALYAGFIIAATFIFNGYLTARPVVLYNEATMSGYRLFTIPVEDFAYGAALILLTTVIYERLSRRSSYE